MTSASDNFNRADEDPLSGGGNWIQGSGFGSLTLISNAVVGQGHTIQDQVNYYTGSWSGDHYSEIKYAGAGVDGGPMVRVQSGAATGYIYDAADGGGSIAKFVGGTYTTLAARNATWATGDRCRLEVVGTTLKVYKNDVQIGANLTDSAISGGAPGLHVFGALSLGDDWVGADVGGAVVTAALTGTATAAITEADVVAGGKTIIITLTNDTWQVAAGGLFDAQRQNIINGIDSAQSETHGWDVEVKAKQGVAGVVRTSNIVVTVTLDAQAAYDITVQETITVTVPVSAMVLSVAPVIATPTFVVTAAGGFIPGGQTMANAGLRTILRM